MAQEKMNGNESASFLAAGEKDASDQAQNASPHPWYHSPRAGPKASHQAGEHYDCELNFVPESSKLDEAGAAGARIKDPNAKKGSQPETEDRHKWARKMEYFLTTIGFCVGMGNVLRFPYICIRNGGGAFLLPYVICLCVCGIPLFFLEVGLGQFLSRGALHVWSICPLFKGIGISMNLLSLLSAWYFSIIISITLIYTVNAFKSPQPWSVCGLSWNSEFCVPSGSGIEDVSNHSNGFTRADQLLEQGGNVTGNWSSISSSREFWLKNVLELSSGLENLDGLPWHTSLAFFVAIFAMFACIIKGVHSVGKVVYVTATLPYILLTVLIIQGATLPGAIDGVLFYIKPDFSKLLDVQTWVEASIQVFASLGPAYGGLITMASYNKFSNNCMRDAVLLSFVCEGSSVFAGFAIFTVLGHMAHRLQVPVSSFASTGPGLAFVVYPEAISFLPVPQLWGVLFFVMLFTVALDTQFTLIETVLTSIEDYWPGLTPRKNLIIKTCAGLIFYIGCLPFASRGGMYLFQLIDWYFSAFTVLLIAILECVVVAWIYGADRFLDDMALMIKRRPPRLFAFLWAFVTPVLLLALLVTTLLTYRPPVYEGYVYGTGGVAFGWFIASVTFLPVPVYAIYKLYRTEGSLLERLTSSCSPSSDWCPGESSLVEGYRHRASRQATSCRFKLPCSCS